MKYKLPVFFGFALLSLVACQSKKKVSLSGEDPVQVSDFIDAFPNLNLPYQLDDTAVVKKNPKDSAWISYKVFTQFIPDSILSSVYGKEKKIKIFPIGKVKNGENLLLAKSISNNHWAAFILAFDKKNNFIAAMPALIPDGSPGTKQYFGIDPRFSLTKSTLKRNSNGSTTEDRDVYTLNQSTKSFLLITTFHPGATAVELTNPIDTFARKNKFSADYVKGAKNLVSIRDSKKNGRLLFFIHFEKNDGECSGELKGEATISSANEAKFKSPGDPCNLIFQFSSSSITIQEQNCGSHRGPDCLFEGTYVKKKEPKKPKKKK